VEAPNDDSDGIGFADALLELSPDPKKPTSDVTAFVSPPEERAGADNDNEDDDDDDDDDENGASLLDPIDDGGS
jgi:hypothetical protein